MENAVDTAVKSSNILDNKSETALREEEVLAFWKERNIFEKTLARGGKEFVFYDGPPFATGLPHHGSLLSSIIKDVIPRYKTMRGFHVRRRWGWDCHGLPIESLVEKELGLKTKKDIETIGVETFNAKARSMVLQFVSDWEHYVERVGRWVDFKNSYKTMDNTYIESVWWALKELSKKNLLYEGKRVLMYCPHCETPLAKAEIAMDNTYKDITEEAVTVKFKVKNPQKHGLPENTFILAWTTTPWTLPGNVALAIGESIIYVVVEKGDERYVLAKDLYKGADPVIAELSGKDVVGIEYESLYDIEAVKNHVGKKYTVLPADFVSTEEGTGIVHTAVMYGEDDFALGQKEDLPMVQLLNANGTYTDQVPDFLRGKYIKDAEKEIKTDLQSRGLLFDRKNNTHSYPHCYRCGTPLIYNAVPSWFINIQSVKKKLLSENEKINWVPEHLKHGRFKNIVENAPDWTISRNRFWASPLPVWKKKGSNDALIIGSLDELSQLAKKSGNRYFVMRHGEANSNSHSIVSSELNDPVSLTEKGRTQVKAALRDLKKKNIDYIFVSPFVRTKETAKIVAESLGVPPEHLFEDSRLSEINTGVFHGKPVSEYHRFFASHDERFTKRPPNGETLRDLKRRVGDFLKDLESTHLDKNILIVTHEYPIWMMTAAALGLDQKGSVVLRGEEEDFIRTAEVREIVVRHIPKNRDHELDLHRPYADEITLVDAEGSEYERIPEVIDCWVESGSMPFAEYHYPFENKKEFEKRAPGDFIAEYIAQTRTWFYYMHAMGVLLFNRIAFRNVISTGTVLASDGEKISKSKRNYTDPLELIGLYGADSLRFYLMSSPIMQSEDIHFRDEDVRDVHNQTIRMFFNSYKFFSLYADEHNRKTVAAKSRNVLDRWILSRLSELVREATDAFDTYDLPLACRAIRGFVDDYSTWYVRRSRDRAKSDDREDKQYTLATQYEVLMTVSKVIAPIAPFIAENIYRSLGGKEESVHLESWPKPGKVDHSLVSLMTEVRRAVSSGLEVRARAAIKVRQPLKRLSIPSKEVMKKPELLSLIMDEVNVKEVVLSTDDSVSLDTDITAELKKEGLVRDVIRDIQDKRKELKLMPRDRISVTVTLPQADFDLVDGSAEEIARATNASHVSLQGGADLSRQVLVVKVSQ